MDLKTLLETHPLANKQNLYMASLLGIIEADAPDDPDHKNAVWFHNVNFYVAESLEIAKAMACKEASDMYPKHKGWLRRSVSVHPVMPDYVRMLAESWDAGFFNKAQQVVEKGDMFDCDEIADDPMFFSKTDNPAS
jgi:hypothetical protein